MAIACRNQSVVEECNKDPLFYFMCAIIQCKHHAASNQAVKCALLASQELVAGGYRDIRVNNLLLAHGTCDNVTRFGATARLATKLKSHGKVPHVRMKTYPGSYHERKSLPSR